MSSSPTANDKKRRRRSDYPFSLSYRTRWSDNDQYAHVNNAVYYQLFDALVNTYLIQHCGLAPTRPDSDADGDQIGLVVSSFCEFFAPLAFPDVLDLGLRVTHLGKSSVTYEVGVFKSTVAGDAESEDTPAAVGGYTHVFVDKRLRTSVTMNARTRVGLEKLVTASGAHSKL
ncbi:thioesterase thiol ester dehydrase-isomerase [Imleria badia]|nr:thioesterase thiol ester dehydrase-isomerase [Imleria badia]